jgi:hypothetical protein
MFRFKDFFQAKVKCYFVPRNNIFVYQLRTKDLAIKKILLKLRLSRVFCGRRAQDTLVPKINN